MTIISVELLLKAFTFSGGDDGTIIGYNQEIESSLMKISILLISDHAFHFLSNVWECVTPSSEIFHQKEGRRIKSWRQLLFFFTIARFQNVKYGTGNK